MRKYFEIAKVIAKAQFSYRFYIFATAMYSVFKILFAVIVWGEIFKTRQNVAGFTLQSMLSYYVVSSFISCFDHSSGMCEEISSRIRGGTISRYMVLPASVEGYFHWQTYGAAAVYVVFNIFAIAVWTLAFGIRLTITHHTPLLLCGAAMAALGVVVMAQINFFIGVCAFKFLSISTFNMMKNNILLFATGGFIPLALLPDGVLAVMRCLPFYYVSYLPTMLIIDRSPSEAAQGLLILTAWSLLLLIVNKRFYNHMRKKYDGVGI